MLWGRCKNEQMSLFFVSYQTNFQIFVSKYLHVALGYNMYMIQSVNSRTKIDCLFNVRVESAIEILDSHNICSTYLVTSLDINRTHIKRS